MPKELFFLQTWSSHCGGWRFMDDKTSEKPVALCISQGQRFQCAIEDNRMQLITTNGEYKDPSSFAFQCTSHDGSTDLCITPHKALNCLDPRSRRAVSGMYTAWPKQRSLPHSLFAKVHEGSKSCNKKGIMAHICCHSTHQKE